MNQVTANGVQRLYQNSNEKGITLQILDVKSLGIQGGEKKDRFRYLNVSLFYIAGPL